MSRGVICTPRSTTSRAWETSSLEEHVALIDRQVKRSVEDPDLRTLARKIIQGRPDGVKRGGSPYVKAWGNLYTFPSCPEAPALNDMQDAQIAVYRIWNFVVLNWTYLPDPPSFDLFSSARYGLDAKASAKLLESELKNEPSDEVKREIREHIVKLRGVTTMGAEDCDGVVIILASLLKAVGFRQVRARVVSTSAEFWEHVYTMVGLPMRQATQLLALDPTVRGAQPGWEYPKSKVVRDFIL